MSSSQQEHILIDLLEEERWDEAASRMNTEEGREEVMMEDEDGWLPLHWACWYGAPFELVEAMMEGYEEAVRVTDKYNGRLPLHWACEPWVADISPPVVRLLLDAYPDGAKVTDDGGKAEEGGYLPLHLAAACRAPLEVLTMLIDANPEGVATGTNNGWLPLHLLARTASPDEEEIVDKVELLFRPLLKNEDARLVPDPRPRWLFTDIGARFDLLRLREIMRIPRCPARVVVDVTRRHPGQLRERDEKGSLPLHLAAANPNLNGEQFQHECLIDTLVNVYPEAAASSNGEGRFPLNLAIESGKRWEEGVEAIAEAAEHVMTVMDVGTNLYAFMLAASRGNPCITTIYKLLRSCPDMCKKP